MENWRYFLQVYLDASVDTFKFESYEFNEICPPEIRCDHVEERVLEASVGESVRSFGIILFR